MLFLLSATVMPSHFPHAKKGFLEFRTKYYTIGDYGNEEINIQQQWKIFTWKRGLTRFYYNRRNSRTYSILPFILDESYATYLEYSKVTTVHAFMIVSELILDFKWLDFFRGFLFLIYIELYLWPLLGDVVGLSSKAEVWYHESTLWMAKGQWGWYLLGAPVFLCPWPTRYRR